MSEWREYWVHSEQPIVRTAPWECPEGEVVRVIERGAVDELLGVIREMRENLFEINRYCDSLNKVEKYAVESFVKAVRVLARFGGDE